MPDRDSRPTRALAALGAAVLALLLCAYGAPPAAAQGTDDLRIERLAIGQQARTMSLAVQVRRPLNVRGLVTRPAAMERAGSRYLCLRLRQGAVRRLACFGPAKRSPRQLSVVNLGAGGRPQGRPRVATTDVVRVGKRTVRARVPFRRLDLRPGRFGIRAISAWSAVGCPGGEPADPETSEPVAGRCHHARPREGMRRARVIRPWIEGCVPSGRTPVSAGSRSRKRIALTFDDGPSAYTGQVLDILRRHRAKATFFTLGSQISGRATLLRRMLRERHVIGAHSWNHEIPAPYWSIAASRNRIREATGFTPCSFRPPGGSLGGGAVSSASSLGMTTVLWDVDPQDWRTPGSWAIASHVLSRARSGSIVLLHDGGGARSQTVAALPSIITTLKSRGYKLVTVPRLLGQRMRWGP